MARLGKVIKGKRYQIGRFAGKWYVADLDQNRFIYGPFTRQATAVSRLQSLAKRIEGKNPRRLTRAKARKILHEGKTRGHTLTPRQRGFFGVRASGYPRLKGKRNPGKLPTPRRSRYSTFRINAGKRVLIYGRVLKIYAQKTSGPYKGQKFVHTFKRGAVMYGMPDGSLKIEHP